MDEVNWVGWLAMLETMNAPEPAPANVLLVTSNITLNTSPEMVPVGRADANPDILLPPTEAITGVLVTAAALLKLSPSWDHNILVIGRLSSRGDMLF